ncbi:thioredoxin [Ruminococcaceae bacterium OttesenSCG-928-L11]|nr:thioredoxin [Ruminococcaceae bacterium OttesenSCG-928-L11]
MTELNKSAFLETIGQDVPTVVDFWATWCMPCQVFAPVVEEIAGEMDGKANFGKVNIDEERDLAIEYGVSSIPTLVIFKGGKEVERLVGVRKKAEVVEAVDKYC